MYAAMTKTAVRDRCRQLVHGTEFGSWIEGEDLDFVLWVLSFHPEADSKTKAGMRVTAGKNVHGTDSFYLCYEDGSKDDFSFVKCLKGMK